MPGSNVVSHMFRTNVLRTFLIIVCCGWWFTGCFNAIVIGGDDEFSFPVSDGGTSANPDTTVQPEKAVPRDTPPLPDTVLPPPDTAPPPPDTAPPPPDTTPPPPDRACACKGGERRPCYTGKPGTQGKGACKAGVQICDINCQWGTCLGQTIPSAEACDGVDNDCNGRVDETFPGINGACKVGSRPGVCGNGKLQCKGGRKVCVGGNVSTEVCDGLDNNCDGKVDNIPDNGLPCSVPGGKGECAKGLFACRGNSKRCIPQAGRTEVCDGKDNDCDGAVDESDPNQGKQCTVPGLKGPCAIGRNNGCSRGRVVCQQLTKPSAEVCDGKDNNCDGMIDNNINVRCYTGPANKRGIGACQEGRVSCVGGKPGPCVGSVLPKTEVCDTLDNDCDGTVDEGNVCVKPGRGPVFRINSLQIASSGQGFDLNGDGKVDNSLAVLGSFVNGTLGSAISGGSVNILIELASLSDPKAQNGTATTYVYMGRATSGGYRIESSSLDSQGRPLFRFASKITGGVLKGGPGRAVLNLPLIGAAIPIALEKAYIQFRVASTLKSLSSGLLGGAIPSGLLDRISAAQIPLLGGPGKTALDVLLRLNSQPDVDLDNDGLESFRSTVTAGITVCIDGDKITKITSGTCAQDKRIADGYSVTFSFTATSTKIVP